MLTSKTIIVLLINLIFDLSSVVSFNFYYSKIKNSKKHVSSNLHRYCSSCDIENVGNKALTTRQTEESRNIYINRILPMSIQSDISSIQDDITILECSTIISGCFEKGLDKNESSDKGEKEEVILNK